MKLTKKSYHTMKEYNYRLKIFKENLFKFIQKNDSLQKRIIIKQDGDNGLRMYIIPDKRLNVDFFEAEQNANSPDEDSVRFEINKFSDMSQQEFDSIFLLDQSFFDEQKNPPFFNPDYDDSKLGIQNIENYISMMEKKGVILKTDSTKQEEKEKSSFFKNPDKPAHEIPEHLRNSTPHLSSDPKHRSIWDLGRAESGHKSPNRSAYDQILGTGRQLENYIKLPKTNEYISMDGVKLPLVLNWRDLNAINEIKDQFKCNACYAFAAIGALEARYRIKTGQMVELSEQEIVDCSRENNGCVGGLPHKVFDYIRRNDINYMRDYPFDESRSKICRKKVGSRFDGSKVKSFTNLPLGLINLLKNLSTGPIAVISYSSYYFKNYAGGIFAGEGCRYKYKANHASVLIGYNLRGPNRYLYFKNGWGTDWGELGFYKVRIDSLSPLNQSHCLIAAHNYNSIPLLD